MLGTKAPALAGAVIPLTVIEDAPLPGSGMLRLADPGAIFAGGCAVAFPVADLAAGFAATAGLPFFGAAALGLRAAGLLGRAAFFAAGFVFCFFFFFAALGIRLFYLL